MSVSKKEYKRAYFALRAEVQRLKEARVTDVQRIAREHGNYGTPGYHDWAAYAAGIPDRTGMELRNLMSRSRDIHTELIDDKEAGA